MPRDPKEPTTVLYARIPKHVHEALMNRCARDRRTISGMVAIILEDWLWEHGAIAPREPVAEKV